MKKVAGKINGNQERASDIEMGRLFVTDQGDVALHIFGNIVRRLVKKEKREERGLGERVCQSALTCYQLSRALNGSVHRRAAWAASKLTNGPFMRDGRQ